MILHAHMIYFFFLFSFESDDALGRMKLTSLFKALFSS